MIKIRTCIACRCKTSKENLLRIVAKNNIAVLDKEQNMNTRGMYICNSSNCINKLLSAKNISKCIKIKVDTESVKELLKNLGE